MDNSYDKIAWAARKQAQRQMLYDKIETYLDELPMEEEKLRQYLTVQGHFPQNSVSNAILIAAQFPTATQYRTYEEWNRQGFSILSGQQHFSILVPAGAYPRRDGKTGTNFAVQQVFDISQTNYPGKQAAQDTTQLLRAMLLNPVCPIQAQERSGGAVYAPKDERIEIGRGLEPDEAIRTLSLAFAHGELAKTAPDYTPGEPQSSFYARCSSFVFCTRAGIDVGGYNFMDSAEIFSGCNNQELKRHLNIIRSTALAVIQRTERAKNQLLSRQREEQDAR